MSPIVIGKRGKTRGVIAGLVPAIPTGMAQRLIIGMARTSPATTEWGMPRVLPLLFRSVLCPAKPGYDRAGTVTRLSIVMESLTMSRMPQTTISLTGDRENFLAMFDVSRETIARLDRFVELLLAWQRRTNLISPSTIPSLWTRHVADSLQLLQLVETAPLAWHSHMREGKEGHVWIDLGSGGGFPGIVIACALADVPGSQVHLIESNMKKASFLREAVRLTGAPAIVHAARIETLGPVLGSVADYVTARALAPLPDLFEMIAPFLKKGAKAFLLKGQDLDMELTEATKHWNIEAESVPSKTSKAGRILIVHTLSKRAPDRSPRTGGGR